MATIYQYMERPPYWIVQDDAGYWLVPARDGGWAERTPFVGHVMNLIQLHDLRGIQLGLD